LETAPNKFTPVLIAAVIIIVISSIPLLQMVNAFCCAGIIAGGFFGTMYYGSRLRETGLPLTFKDSAAIGVLSGIIAAFVVTMISTMIQLAMNHNPIPDMYELFESQGFDLPENVDQILQNISNEYTNDGYSKTIIIFSLIIDLITYPLFSTVGGIIAASVLSRRNKLTDNEDNTMQP
jgi:hypothetical protein